jgi:hypothetical protein
MIMKLGRRGMIVSTSALEKREGDMLGSMQSCFENARSMHVSNLFGGLYVWVLVLGSMPVRAAFCFLAVFSCCSADKCLKKVRGKGKSVCIRSSLSY